MRTFKSYISHGFILAMSMPFFLSVQAAAQFSWDGDCSILWHECCNIGSDQNPLWINNWSVDPNPSSCPPVPGPNDTPSLSGLVDSQGYQIGLTGLFQSGTFLCRAQSLTIDGGDIYTSGPFPPEPPSQFRVIEGSIINLMDGATIDVGSFSIFDVHSGLVRMFGVPGALMHIGGGGTLTKTAQPEAFSSIDVPIDNDGFITVDTGTLHLRGGGTSDGLIAPADGTTIRMEGQFTDIGGEVAGDGTIWFSGGTATITGNYHPRNTHIFYGGGGSTVHFESDNSIENLTLGGSGALGGAGDITIDDLNWYDGPMLPGGKTIVQDTVLFQGNYAVDLKRRMDLLETCTATLAPNSWLRMEGAEVYNHGDFILQENSTIAQFEAASSGFKNYGTLTKTGGGTGTINVLVSNFGGTVDVQSGTLRFDAQMASTGAINVNAGAEVVLGHGAGQSLFPEGSIIGEGTLRFSGGVLDWIEGTIAVPNIIVDHGLSKFQSDISTDTLTMIDGKILGMGDVTVNNQLTWHQGEMADEGVTIAQGTVQTTAYALLNRVLELDNVKAPVVPGAGTLHVSETVPGLLRGSGTVGGHVSNRGTVSPGVAGASIGVINITGDYSSVCCWNGQLRIDLEGASHDQLSVAATAALGGTLTVSGSPIPGQSYTILTASNRINGFDYLNLPAGMTVEYTPTSVIVHAPFGPPQLVDFDTYPNGSPAQSGDVFTDQWASVGVVFSDGAGSGPGPSANHCSISPPNHAAANGLIVAIFVDPCTGEPSATDKASMQQDWCWAGGEGLDVYAYDLAGNQIGHQFSAGGGASASFDFDSQVIARLDIYHMGQGIDNLSFTLPASVGECCPADVAPTPNGDGMVNIDDLFAVIAAWGACADCPADIDDDGDVDIDDLFAVIAAWGPCP